MAGIAQTFSQLVGNTPMLRLQQYEQKEKLQAKIVAKLEYFEPAGSVKDRVALHMIEQAEQRGWLQVGATIIEPTSGNTGIGLAAVAAGKGYKVILTMPDSMSMERRKLLAAYGAEVVLTAGTLGMQGAIDEAHRLAENTPGSFMPGQFDNPDNPDAHRKTTAPEIWRDTGGEIDIFVAGVGTGGTISGIGGYLKEKNPGIEVVAVEPADSPLLGGGKAGPHKLQGIGANFVPQNLDRNVYDRAMGVEHQDAYKAVATLAHTEGVLCGISSGAALWVATQLAKEPQNVGKTIVVLLPDGGERYLSTEMI